MAIATVPGLIRFPDMYSTIPVLAYLALTIDAAAEKAAAIVRAPKAGVISKVWWRTMNVTTGDTVDVRLETVDAATGAPTGTLLGANSNASQVVGSGDDNTVFTTTLTTGPTVAKGDLFAIVIVQGAVPGVMEVATLQGSASGGNGGRWGQFPYSALYTTSWAKSSNVVCMTFEYDDGSYAQLPGVFPASTLLSESFNTGSTPDEIGNIFQVPFPCTVGGAWVLSSLAGDATLKLYDSDGSTVLASVALDKDVRGGQNRPYEVPFTSSITLTKDTNYRLTLLPTSATNVAMEGLTVNAAAVMNAFCGGANMHRTERTDAGAWTQTTTSRMWMGVFIDGLDDGVQVGGGGGCIIGGG